MAKILVDAPKADREVVNGVIAVNPNNTDYGSIQLSQTAFTVNTNGFMNQERRVGFITGEVTKLKAFVEALGLTPGCDYSKKANVDMKLVVEESTTPYYEGQSPKINPKTNEELVTPDGEFIYRRVVLAEEASDKSDIKLDYQRTTTAQTATVTSAHNVLSEV